MNLNLISSIYSLSCVKTLSIIDKDCIQVILLTDNYDELREVAALFDYRTQKIKDKIILTYKNP